MDPFNAKLVAAAIGSSVTALTMTPFDVVKTRLQTQRPATNPLFPRPTSLQACCRPNSTGCVRNMSSYARQLPQELVCIWDHGMMRTERVNGFLGCTAPRFQAEGLKGLWKGAGTTFNIALAISNALFAGTMARGLISSLASPLELVRTNLQSTPLSPGNPHTLRSVLTSVRGIARTHGVHSLWRGLGPTLWRDVPFSGIYWANYEQLKGVLRKHGREGASAAFASGAVSGTLASLITAPFDTIKTRRQALVMTSTIGGSPQISTSLVAVLRDVIRTEGVAALFAGLTPRIAKVAPACGIMISCFEGIGGILAKPQDS
ncbi:mitochondrial carrier [Phellopilus nigrolimitatus]|nr:mitochondrial carrier [Phellopilus nigrolimitatus]